MTIYALMKMTIYAYGSNQATGSWVCQACLTAENIERSTNHLASSELLVSIDMRMIDEWYMTNI
jgi:hypothetical protein